MSALENATDQEPGEFWLFGYGLGWSLNTTTTLYQHMVMMDAPSHTAPKSLRRTAIDKHLTKSEDHRGTPDAPGRVVTLLERTYWETLTDYHNIASDKVWGVAYRIPPERVAEVKDYLDIREINGYTIHHTSFHPAVDAKAAGVGKLPPPIPQTLVYIGTPDNEQFVGPQHPEELARHIWGSEGPSGRNRDYLFGLDDALRELSPESVDEHVSDLARRVRCLEEMAGGAPHS
ncbi:hypothetical protein E4U21_000337 [Claviceps maximensis]|nr:hypothetical protein E4U21_000337 [Claviceps maximensis]